MGNPATTISMQDERIPGLPVLPPGTDSSTLTVPVYNPKTDKTHQGPLGGAPPTTNAVIGAPKFVRYRDSRLYGVPADALTLDRLNPATIVPRTEATVANPANTPLTNTEPAKTYVATVVPAGTAGAVLVPAFIGAAASNTVPILWVERTVTIPGPNDRPDTQKNVRFYLAADLEADGNGGDCFEKLNKEYMCVQGISTVQMYRTDRTKAFEYDVKLVAVYDPTSTILIHRSGSFFDSPADRVPVRFVRLDSLEARYGFVRRDTTPASIDNWSFGELSIWELNGEDEFATAKQAKGPFPAFTGVETAYWKPAAKPDGTGPLLASELIASRQDYAGLLPRAALLKLLNSTTSGAITPAPPSWTFNAETRVLTLAHGSYGASELEFSYQNAAYQQYVEGLSVDASAHPAGDWKGRVKAVTGRDASAAANSPQLGAAGAATVLYPQASDFSGNSYDEPTSISGVRRLSSLASLALSLNAPYIDVDVFVNVNNQNAPNQCVAVLDANHTLLQKLVSDTKDAPSTVRVSLPSGQKTILLALPDVANAPDSADGTNLLFGAIRSITIPAGYTGSIVTPDESGPCLYAINDSIFNGAGVDTPQVDGVAPRLQALIPGLSIGIDGWNGRQSTDDYVGVLARAQAYLSEASTRWVLIELGTNDKLTSARTPVECATRIVNLASYLRDNIPGVQVFVQTPLITQAEEVANERGHKMSDFRTAIANAVAGTTNVRLIDGTLILSPSSGFKDPYHLDEVGNSDYADYLHGVFVPGSVTAPYELGAREYIKLPGTASAVSATSFSLAFMMSVSEAQVQFGHVWAMRRGSFTVKNYGTGCDTQSWGVDSSDTGGFGGAPGLIEVGQSYFVGITLGANGSIWMVGNSNQSTVVRSTPVALLKNAVDAILGARQNNDNSFTDFCEGMGIRNVSFWQKELTLEQLQALRAINAQVPASGPLNYQDADCLIFSPMGEPDGEGHFTNLAEPSSPLLLATA